MILMVRITTQRAWDYSFDMYIPRIFHQIWLGPAEIHPDMLMWAARLRELHPNWTYKLWREGKEPGTLVCGAETLHAHRPDLLGRACHYTQQSNIWRYEVVYTQGGVYLDCDVEPFKNLEPLIADHTAFVGTHWNGGIAYATSFFGAVAQHPWLKEAIDRLPEQDPRVGYSMGDRFLSSIVHTHPEVFRCPRETFVSWYQPRPARVRQDLIPTSCTDCYAVHRWSSCWHPTGYKPLAVARSAS